MTFIQSSELIALIKVPARRLRGATGQASTYIVAFYLYKDKKI